MKKFLIIFFIFILSSCTQLSSIGFRSYSNKFTANLNRATKTAKLYRNFETIALAKITHFTSTLMRQYVNYTQSNLPNITKNQIKKVKKLIKESKEYNIYWLALYTSDTYNDNLSSNNSFWTVYLSCDDQTYVPLSIRVVPAGSFASQWLYMIHAGRWPTQYEIKFKKTNCKNVPSRLIIASFLGTMDFRFER